MRKEGTGRWLGAILVALALASPAGAQQQPSIVLVLTDDQRFDTLERMPTVQSQLVGRGVRFTNAFVVNPVCCPSRASTLTGQYSRTTGVYANSGKHGGFQVFRDSATIATALQAAGYETALFGKYLNGYQATSYVPPGWSRWAAFTSSVNNHYYSDFTLNEDGAQVAYGSASYSTDVLGRAAADFVRDTDGPLFVLLAPTAPHSPAIPAARHAGAFAGMEPWRPPNYDEEDMTDKPAFAQRRAPWNEDRRTREDAFHEDQLETLLAVDDAVAGLLDALEDTGRLGNTLFVVTSDNGLSWGENRWNSKYVADESSIRVPLVMRYDPLVAAPRKEGRFALNVDLAPTFAALAGTRFPAEGHSLVPLLRGGPARWRSDFIVEHLYGYAPPYCALRRSGLKYVQYSTGEEELYDLAADPYELENLAADPARRKLRHAQRLRLIELCDPPPPAMTLRGPCTLGGSAGADRLVGSRWFDYVCALGGDDRIRPLEGEDVVVAAGGDDVVLARDGRRDTIRCGDGRDRVVADRFDQVTRDCETVRRS